MPPKGIPDEFDPNGYCSVCDHKFKRKANYRQYLREIHKMSLTPLKPTKDLDITPAIDNSTKYCNSCNWTYESKRKYHCHLRKAHGISCRENLNPNISPDIDDRNFYCQSCQIKYKARRDYRLHLRRVHKIVLVPILKKTIYDPTISVEDTQIQRIKVV